MNEKHKLMKPKDPARIGRQASRRAKKWQSRLSAALLCALLFTVFFPSCRDEELMPSAGTRAESLPTEGTINDGTTGLVQDEITGYWKATRRIPLVGTGRVVNNISESLVSLGSYEKLDEYEEGANNLVDFDLNGTTFSPTDILGTDVGLNQIVSILDLNYDYAGGQKAGFVIQMKQAEGTTGGLLDVGVLDGYWVDTYLNGVRTGESLAFSDETSLVDLGLGNISGGNAQAVYTLEGTFNKPFDEIRLGSEGVTLSALSDISIMYAYVGENPMIPAVNNGSDLSTSYFGNKVTTPKGTKWAGGYQDVSLGKLIDGDLDNGLGIELLSGLFQPRMTIDFGRPIPKGSEIGFYVTSGHLLDIGAGATTVVTTYDGEEEKERYSQTDIVSVTLAGGGSAIYSLITSEECDRAKIEFDGLNLDIGVTVVHYAFVREPTTVDASSYFTFTNATVYNPNYRFADVPAGGKIISYEVISKPATAGNAAVVPLVYENDEGGTTYGYVLQGMNATGNYVIKATYEDVNGNVSEHIATITRLVKPKTDCNTPLVNAEDATPENEEYTAYVPEGFDGIVVGGGSTENSVSYVTDYNIGNYIQYTDVNITIAANQGIIGVKKNNGKINEKINGEKNAVRTGFVINRKSYLLGADVLKFMRIRLLNDGHEVQSGLANDNNGVSLSLIGESDGLVRLSIDTSEEFDAIELYSSGLLNLNLGTGLSVYYAFKESVKDDCGNPGEECMQLISNANYGALASIDTQGLLSVAVTVADLGYMVDGNMDTYTTLVKPVSLAQGTTINVTFDKIKGNQEVGFIFSDISGLTNVDLIGIMQIKAFMVTETGEEEISDETTGGLLNLKVIGKGDRAYVSTIPPKDFNKLQLIIGQGVGAFTTYLINGVYIRPDFDGDGIMDCVDDNASTNMTGLKVLTEDICLGDGVKFEVSGGVEGATYTLEFEDKNDNYAVKGRADVVINTSGGLNFLNEQDFFNIPAGEYYITVSSANLQQPLNKAASLTIHPKQTTWNGSIDSDWNKWGNWNEGTPWDCTNVFIPRSTIYPNLKYSETEKSYWCNNIHFASDAELIAQNRLNYVGKVFFDKELTPGTYQLLSMPLEAMVTGDMFVLANVSGWEEWRNTKDAEGLLSNYFLEIRDNNTDNVSNYSEHRTNPLVYQRFWSKTVTNKTLTRAADGKTDDPAIAMNDWSKSFNAVGTPYELGQGFAVKVEDKNGGLPYHFHFPKSDNEFHYYDADGNYLYESDPTDRRGNIGDFFLKDLSVPITLTRESSGDLFLFGNPLMSHINIEKFFEQNDITEVQVFDGNEYIPVTKLDRSITQIAPMEAVFVKANTSGTTYNIMLTEAMLEQGNSTSTTAVAPNQLRLTATSRGRSASCVVVPSSVASDDYDAREDATLLVGSEEGSGVAVYTVAGGKALSIQRMNSQKRIPVGFYLKEEGSVSLSFDPQGDAWQGWTLVDSQTGKRYPLDSEISLGTVKSGAGRFYLEAD